METADFKCKYCGGEVCFEPGKTVGKCLACGKEQTADDETAYALAMAQMSRDVLSGYEAALQIFRTIPGVKDADAKAAVCQTKIEELKAREEEYEQVALWRDEQEKMAMQAFAAARRRRRIVTASVVAVCAVLFILALTVFLPGRVQGRIKALMDAGDYDTAYSLLAAFGDENTVFASKYDRAETLIAEQDYETAYLLLSGVDYKDASDLRERIRPEYERVILSRVQVGEYACFGAYEQDGDTENGQEDIEWLLLAKEGNSVLLISRYALDCQPFHRTDTSVTFAASDLRVWLNGNFLSDAFSTAEAAMIENTVLPSEALASADAQEGETQSADKVFLLSISEAETYFAKDRDRWCAPTAYAIARGAWAADGYTVGGKSTAWWWLRSQGSSSGNAACVLNSGAVSAEGRGVYNTFLAVRPVIRVNLGG